MATSEALPVLLGQSLAKCVTPPQILQQPPYKISHQKFKLLTSCENNVFHLLLTNELILIE